MPNRPRFILITCAAHSGVILSSKLYRGGAMPRGRSRKDAIASSRKATHKDSFRLGSAAIVLVLGSAAGSVAIIRSRHACSMALRSRPHPQTNQNESISTHFGSPLAPQFASRFKSRIPSRLIRVLASPIRPALATIVFGCAPSAPMARCIARLFAFIRFV